MVKINLPSHFIPRLNSDEQKDILQEITNRALDINIYKTTIDRTGHYDERRRATNSICEAFSVILNKVGELCLTTDERKTADIIKAQLKQNPRRKQSCYQKQKRY